MPISVALVDDHAVVREAVAGMLDMQDDVRVVGQAGSLADGRALLERLLASPPPGPLVAVVDVTMPDGSGLALVRATRERSKDVGLVVLTMHNDDSTLLEALDAGASALGAQERTVGAGDLRGPPRSRAAARVLRERAR